MNAFFHNPFAVILLCLTISTAIGALRYPWDSFYAWLYRFLTGMVGVMSNVLTAKVPEAKPFIQVSTETSTEVSQSRPS